MRSPAQIRFDMNSQVSDCIGSDDWGAVGSFILEELVTIWEFLHGVGFTQCMDQELELVFVQYHFIDMSPIDGFVEILLEEVNVRGQFYSFKDAGVICKMADQGVIYALMEVIYIYQEENWS